MAHRSLSPPAGGRPVLPSWALSTALHLLAMLLLGWLLGSAPRGAAEEPGRSVGIVLKHATIEGDYYEGEQELLQEADDGVQTSDGLESGQPTDVAHALPSDAARLDPSDALPAGQAAIGAGALQDGAGHAGELTSGGAQPRAVSGGRARVSVFGVEGEGRKFVYVFDRSFSMFGAPLEAAKYQLVSSLESLESTHQFQIIFFNHNNRVFDLSGGQNRIPFADERTKQLARKFVGGMTADGGTDRYGALIAAIDMRPDVIFFLTDEDNPMSPGELERIRRKNRGAAALHVIEFGVGPQLTGNHFLARLARENSGSYVYVDTVKLRP